MYLANVNLQGHSLFHSWLLAPGCVLERPPAQHLRPHHLSSQSSRLRSHDPLSAVDTFLFPFSNPLGHRLVIGSPFFNRQSLFWTFFPSLSFTSQRNPRSPTQRDTPGRACSVPFPIRLRANFPPCTDRLSRSDPAFFAAGSSVSLRGRVFLDLNDGHFNRGRETAGWDERLRRQYTAEIGVGLRWEPLGFIEVG